MEVKILGITYEVKEVECVSKYESLLGKIDYIEQVIYVQRDLPKDRKQEVLLHEIVHGIAEAIGYEDVFNEKAVQILARSLYSLFIENTIFSLKVFEKEQSQQQL